MAGSKGLNDTFLKNLKCSDQKKHFDGGGLYIFLTKTGSKLWRMAYRFGGKQKLLSFGAYPAVSLKRARQLCDEAKGNWPLGLTQERIKKLPKRSLRRLIRTVSKSWPVNGLKKIHPGEPCPTAAGL